MNDVKLISFLDLPYELQLETRNWRNSENVSKYFKIKYIEEDTHKKWLSSLNIKKPKNIAFVIEVNKEYIGVVYFHSIDYDKKQGDWGIYIYKDDFRGKGIGTEVLTKSIEYAKNELKLNFLFLDVLDSNNKAKKLYEKLGFIFTGDKDIQENKVFLRYRLEL